MRTKKMITKVIAVTVSMALLCPGMVLAETLEEPSLQDDDQIVLEDIGKTSEDVTGEILQEVVEDNFDADYVTEDADIAADIHEDEIQADGDTAGTGKNLQLGHAVIGEREDVNTATAATVYFGSQGGPLSWRVIGYNASGVASSADTATLLASDNINASVFDDTSTYSHVYSASKLQTAVNTIYTSSFNSYEDSSILPRTLRNGSYSGSAPTDGVAGTEVSNAKLWPLSTYEAYYTNNDLRKASVDWWLRSPGNNVVNAAYVDSNGLVDFDGDAVSGSGGVRPAFNLNLSSIILTSAAVGGKDPGIGGDGTLNEVAAYTGTAWKLTVHDTSRDGDGKFTASAKSGATLSQTEGYSSWTVPIVYSDAQTGTNEHVSAILTDSEGVALYYGYIATNSAESGDTGVNVTIPTGLTPGRYKLKVFNEQCNGDKKTDLSSDFHDIELTVYSKAIAFVNNGTAPNIYGEQESSVYFGNYQQGSDGGTGFLIEPVKWRVLENKTDDKTLFLLSDKNLDCKKYNEDYTGVTWEISTLRGWLNGLKRTEDPVYDYSNDNFIKSAFTNKEAHALATTAVVNDDNLNQGMSGGNDTNDKVFLLSIAEASNNNYGFTDDNSRKSANTDYAQAANGVWWLRSPANSVYDAADVDGRGNVDYIGDNVNDSEGVRPALNINLSSIILTSAAEGGKISGTTGSDSLKPVDNATGTTEWKFTVHDTDRDGEGGFTAKRHGDTALAPGAKLSLSYKGATTGSNEYISAIITDAGNTILYYGNIAKCESENSGTATINIPNDNSITSTCKLYVFQEQCNGDKKTDYSSQLLDWSTLEIKDTPTAEDFDVMLPTNLVYNGNAKEATAEVKSGITGMGDITVKYQKGTDTATTTAPTEPGTYKVILDVAEGDNYAAVTGITKDDWKFTITDSTVPVRSVEVSPKEITLKPGETKKLKSVVKPDNATNRKVRWKSNKERVATVDPETGEVKAEAEGEATITAITEDGGKTDTCKVIVKKEAPKPAPKYSVTVKTEGKGTATADPTSAKAGKKVNIKAIPDAGNKFKKWKVSKGVGLTDATKASTSFIMPSKNVTVKAIFEKIIEDPQPEIKPVGDDKITIAWWKVDEAKGYDIFMSLCNHDGKEIKPKLVKTIKGNKTFSWTATGLKPNRSYKALVKAYVKKDGKKKYISVSPLMHVYTAGGTKNYTNAKSIKLDTSDGKIKKSKLKLNVKDTYKIKASVKKADKKRKLMPATHVRTLRYRSSDPGIATVSKSGKITAKRAGKCKIYVYAHNGVNKTITVTVK